jgi:aldose 1-epimerase
MTSGRGALILRRGEQEAAVVASLGGRVAAYRSRQGETTIDWLQPLPVEPPAGDGDSLAGGCFPLLPYGHHLPPSRLTWQGRQVRLAASRPAAPRARLHGVGWLRPWQVIEARADIAQLQLTHPGDGDWPWRFVATETIRLDGEALYLSLAITNGERGSQPVGLGFHPTFPAGQSVRLAFQAAAHWPRLEAGPPPLPQPVPATLDFGSGRVAPATIDDSFAWSGNPAEIHWPDGRQATLAASPELRFLTVTMAPGGQFVSLAPLSHGPAPVGSDGDLAAAHGLLPLPGGETFSVNLTLRPS